ncbi:hypothetical protein FH5_03905 [Priestia endophytica]|nr:hypothetical protein FH5_03905 [Priestia endophytica]
MVSFISIFLFTVAFCGMLFRFFQTKWRRLLFRSMNSKTFNYSYAFFSLLLICKDGFFFS